MSEEEFRKYIVNRQISRPNYLFGPEHTFRDDGAYVSMGGTILLGGRYRFANGEACVTLGPAYGSPCFQFRVVDRLVTMRSSEDRDTDPRFHLVRIR